LTAAISTAFADWQHVGTAEFSAKAYYITFALDSADTPYLAYQDWENSYKASVKKFDGEKWVHVGTAGFTYGIARFPSLAVSLPLDSPAAPYVAYSDDTNDSKVSVIKYDGISWSQVGAAGFSETMAEYISLALDSANTPYVFYRDMAYKDVEGWKGSVMKFDGEKWVQVGTAGFTTGLPLGDISLALDSKDTPYVAYNTNYANGYKASVMKFDGSSWVQVGLAGFTTVGPTVGGLPLTVQTRRMRLIRMGETAIEPAL